MYAFSGWYEYCLAEIRLTANTKAHISCTVCMYVHVSLLTIHLNFSALRVFATVVVVVVVPGTPSSSSASSEHLAFAEKRGCVFVIHALQYFPFIYLAQNFAAANDVFVCVCVCSQLCEFRWYCNLHTLFKSNPFCAWPLDRHPFVSAVSLSSPNPRC